MNRGHILNIETKNESILNQQIYNRENHTEIVRSTFITNSPLHFLVHQTDSCIASTLPRTCKKSNLEKVLYIILTRRACRTV